MKCKYLLLLLMSQFVLHKLATAQDEGDIKGLRFDNKSPNILINYLNSDEKKDAIEFKLSPVESITASSREWLSKREGFNNNMSQCRLYAEMPVFLSINPSFGKFRTRVLLIEPGDSITIIYHQGRLSFKGKCSKKAELQMAIDSVIATIALPSNRKDYLTLSLQDYLDWCDYLNKELELVLPLIDSYKKNMSSYALNLIRALFIDQNIDDRSDKFASLAWVYSKQNNMPNENLCSIYDTTYYPVVSKYFPMSSGYVFGTWKPILFQVDRRFSFDYTRDSLNTAVKRKILYYKEGKAFYKGRIRELFIQKQLAKEFIRKVGFIPETEQLLASYYAEKGFPEYKQWLKEFELQRRDILNEKSAFNFEFTDIDGNSFTKDQLRGKVVIFDFWFTGCVGCIQMKSAMERIRGRFRADTNMIFVNVSVDKNKGKWIKSIEEDKFTSRGGLHVYTGGRGTDDEMLKRYGIKGFPFVLVMNPWGTMVHSLSRLDPRLDDGRKFIAALEQQQRFSKDGPYVFRNGQVYTAYFINGASVLSEHIIDRDKNPLPVTTDENIDFNVILKRELKIEPSVFAEAKRLLVLSDIEGNFDAFRKLLQANHIIDKDYNWAFGNGHLVLNGDIFDRGDQVSECLWLIYSLEEKAKVAGGYVHFVLGNHEVMNLQGNSGYVRPKYIYNARLLERTTKDLYGEDSELGRWLRTKNIMEKIGDLLFVHGGIGKEFSDSVKLSIPEINNMFRRRIDEVYDSDNGHSDFMFSQFYSPFWFRLYYKDKDEYLVSAKDTAIRLVVHHPSGDQINQILKRWSVRKIITGHTIVADTVSVHYDGKVLNTDTDHAKGKSEALLIEDGNYFRVDKTGLKYLLFDNRRRMINQDLTE
ncbi:metallophosphoesterase [Chitinophaga sp. CF418]|uniref:metallophosphoesterase n=1 Tax=Chitinophaga sp. CF418 TaxID=1855287 RepID=UPI000918E405|nr:metallophosphoesterase [Chitinophaga sp. CF418]SHM37171.1 Thioredoxin-like [Chitinophaga sp. CF418]